MAGEVNSDSEEVLSQKEEAKIFSKKQRRDCTVASNKNLI